MVAFLLGIFQNLRKLGAKYTTNLVKMLHPMWLFPNIQESLKDSSEFVVCDRGELYI